MKNIPILLFLLPIYLHAQGCIVGNPPPRAQYVCFDGRSLECTPTGLIWNAKRGCFMSRLPCCAYQANHYGYYPNHQNLVLAFEQCRLGYPYHLGEMQTH